MSARSSRQFHLTSLESFVDKYKYVVSDILDTSRFSSLTACFTSDEVISPDRAAIMIEQSPDGQNWYEAIRKPVDMIADPIPIDNSFQVAYSPIMKFARVRIASTSDFYFRVLSAWAEAKT